MSSPGGAATQICGPQFDRSFFSLPVRTQEQIQHKIDELGSNLRGFSHHSMQGVDAFRLRAGDFRVIYQFNVEKNILFLIAVGNRRDIYKKPLNKSDDNWATLNNYSFQVKSPNPTTARQDVTPPPPLPPDEQTSLPGLRTWPRVYILVVFSFILWVVLLRMLTRLFA